MNRTVLTCAILMLFCPGILIFNFGLISQQWQSQNWPVVEGTVDRTFTTTTSGRRGRTNYLGKVNYHYAVNGVGYSSNLTFLGSGNSHSSEESALAEVSKYTPGSTVPVYYDPAKPEVAVLRTGLSTFEILFNIGLLIVPVICAVVLYRHFRTPSEVLSD